MDLVLFCAFIEHYEAMCEFKTNHKSLWTIFLKILSCEYTFKSSVPSIQGPQNCWSFCSKEIHSSHKKWINSDFVIKLKMLWPQNSKIGSLPAGSLPFKPFITVLDLVCSSTIFLKRIIHPLKTFCGFSTHFLPLNNCKCSFLHVEKIRGNDLLLLHIIFV